MKIKNLVYDLVVEAVMSKSLLQELLNKWRIENPDITPEQVEKIYIDFKSKQNGLNAETPSQIVYTFLSRFDGNHGFTKFNPTTEALQNIKSYTYTQIRSLLNDYPNSQHDDHSENATFFDMKDQKSTPEKIELSHGLWTGRNNCIVNEGTFRVYKITDQIMSMAFGYYLEAVNKAFTGGKNSPWCVTWRNDRNMANQWPSYRMQGRTFYFVIDESRDAKTDKYFMSALQISSVVPSNYKYILTPLTNNDDSNKDWATVTQVYPQLSQFKELISPTPYSDKETKETNIVGNISEVPGKWEFARVSRNLKKLYIDNLGEIKTVHSWNTMDEKLKRLYIDLTTAQNYKNRFSSYELLFTIKKDANIFGSLDRKLKMFFPEGIGILIDQLQNNEFYVRRTSIDKPHIKLYESKQNGKCGLFDTNKMDWLDYDGVKYEPFFEDSAEDSFKDEQRNRYLVEIFKFLDKTFYSIVPVNGATSGRSHFVTEKKWKDLQIDLNTHRGGFNQETDTDIN